MSARDLMRSSDSSQSQQEATRFKIFDNSEIPICIRNSSGVFVYSNHNFSNVIKGCEYDSAYWFEKLPLEIKCLLLESEVEALANADVAMIKSVIIEGSFYWCVLFQVIYINSEIFIAWSFLKDVVFSSLNSKCISYVAGDVSYLKNPALLLEPGVYQSFCLFFSGFSHEFISRLLCVTSGTSKNRISKSYSIMGVDNKDDMILYLKANSFLPSVHRYAFELISAKCSHLLKW
ncbi:hypothetical protein [Enterobacter cloacae]|uniref:Conjugal transfer transcriptional regulator TraJ n=1 Tax=Enterobacter cloacae TaxID=550 RepID=A0A427KFE1_ENTCL|nr:hypothetical protein [Enterobacter cloacae]RSB26232.1 hypothetical protein EGK68_23115 [Enterobacter cloacae]